MDFRASTVHNPVLSADFCWERQTGPEQQKLDRLWMGRALRLAKKGEGLVEPNPMVGCVLVKNEKLLGEGWHANYGGPHAEVNALLSAGEAVQGATAYVTLEPCCHWGKTGPCTEALIGSGISKVVVGCQDPFPEVAGKGLSQLRSAGISVVAGCLETEAKGILAPYLCLVENRRPWVIAKWAMTLDGKIASSTGTSKWISCEKSRALVHLWRGQVDGILVGSETTLADDPLLTPRPAGHRVPARIVMDRRGRLPKTSQLVTTASQSPVIVFTSPSSDPTWLDGLVQAGVEVHSIDYSVENSKSWLTRALMELGKKRFTNILVEGGGQLLGSFFDQGLVDECRVFISATILGGNTAVSPVAGMGFEAPWKGWIAPDPVVERVGRDVLIRSVRIPMAQPVDNSKSRG